MAYRDHMLTALQHEAKARVAEARFTRAIPRAIRDTISRLRPGSVVIDCGAHVGIATRLFARTGAIVYAIEPNPVAFAQLVTNTARLPNALPIHAAALTNDASTVDLHLHAKADQDAVAYASGSSLMSSKPNVSSKHVVVPGLNLIHLVQKLNHVDFLKMDVEGYETVLVPHLVQSGAAQLVQAIAIETHDGKWADIGAKTTEMRETVNAAGLSSRFFWDWP